MSSNEESEFEISTSKRGNAIMIGVVIVLVAFAGIVVFSVLAA